MELFIDGNLSTQAFGSEVRRGTRELSEVLAVAARTKSPAVESTHFLIALARIQSGVTQHGLTRRGLSVEQWETGLADCANSPPVAVPPTRLTQSTLAESALEMLQAARARCEDSGDERISEAVLLSMALAHATEAVAELCQNAGVDLAQWRAELEQVIEPPPPIPVFQEQAPQQLVFESFSPSGKKVIRLMRTETESLGYDKVDPRHLLLALLECEGGAMHYGLYQQGLLPRKVQEAVMLNLRGKAKLKRSNVSLDCGGLQPTVQQICQLAGQLVAQDQLERITEAHLLRAFLMAASSARSLLADQRVDVAALREAAEHYDAAADGEEEDESMADIDTVRQRLKSRLVGQDRAIDQILPYIEFMRFGMTTPGHPVGVFLFCGQSGSGKTEMAKELANAVYGSEENLIFLEMGQFNAPESMNIFVGAPPGYIGYGEGKLTNGLRDKPRAVVLFDEVEKAHAKVLDALLRFLDEGRIDDPAGPVRDGSQCIVILTSNVAADDLDDIWRRVADQDNWRTLIRKQLRDEFKKHDFRVEFLNRVDEVILFNTLRPEDYVEIAERNLNLLLEILRQQFHVDVVPEGRVAESVGRYCAEMNEGARSVLRLTRTLVVLPVARFVQQNDCLPPVKLAVRLKNQGDDASLEPITEVGLR